MKQKIILLLCIMMGAATISLAQPGSGFQRLTVEERVKRAHEKIDSAFRPNAETMAKIDTMFKYYFIGADAIRQDIMSGGGMPDFQALQERMKPLNEAKDNQMKAYLGEENFVIYKEKIEPMILRRPGGGPGGPGGFNRQQQ
jgi:hypothetical protein